LKSVEEVEREFKEALLTGHPHLQAQAGAMQKVIALTLIEILREIRSFLQNSQKQEKQEKGRHK
jgi:hypothetical protein